MKEHFTILTLAATLLTPSLAVAQNRSSRLPGIGPNAGYKAGTLSSDLPNSAGVSVNAVSFGTIDFPGAPASAAYGINDAGQIVGAYGRIWVQILAMRDSPLRKMHSRVFDFRVLRKHNASVSTAPVRS